MDMQSELYIGGESGPRKAVLDNLRDWLGDPNAEKIKPLRGAYFIGKTFSIKYLCEEFKFKTLEINWDDEVPASKMIETLTEKIFEMIDKLSGLKNYFLKRKLKKEKNIKKSSDLSLKYTQLASLIEYYNRLSGETIVLIINSCKSQKFKEQFNCLVRTNIENNIKIICEKYEENPLIAGSSNFKNAKIIRNYRETLFLEPPDYNNIENYIKEHMNSIDTGSIIEYVGCHPAFLKYLESLMKKDEIVNSTKLELKIKTYKLNFEKLLWCYFDILKRYEFKLYSSYTTCINDFNEYPDDEIPEMIKWALLYNDTETGEIKTPILFKNYVKERINNLMPKIFVCHASEDKEIVSEFIDKILILGIEIKLKNIFCSSVDGIKMATGIKWLTKIKENLKAAEIVIVFITKNYKKSEFCQNEIGAAWILGRTIIPLILDPIDHRSVGDIIGSLQIEKLNESQSLDRIRVKLQNHLNISSNIEPDRWTKLKENYIEFLKNVDDN